MSVHLLALGRPHVGGERTGQRKYISLYGACGYSGRTGARIHLPERDALRGLAVLTTDGAQALAAFSRHAFDLILMDVQMPVMSGYDAAQAIRAAERDTGGHIPIVALTAHAMKGDREICLNAGMDDYLGKSIPPQELTAVLERRGKIIQTNDAKMDNVIAVAPTAPG